MFVSYPQGSTEGTLERDGRVETVGARDGLAVTVGAGVADGDAVDGCPVGTRVGSMVVGTALGELVVGTLEGIRVGLGLGASEGRGVGSELGE